MARNKFTGKQKRQIVRWIAEGYTAKTICRFIQEQWDQTCRLENIQNNYVDAKKEEWLAIRLQLDKELSAHAIYPKAARLNRIHAALEQAMEWRTDQIIHHKGEIIAEIEKQYLGIIAPLLAEASKLIEGDKSGVNININNWQAIVEKANADSARTDNAADDSDYPKAISERSRALGPASFRDAALGEAGRDLAVVEGPSQDCGQELQRSREVENGG